jgi:hypothetical protein
MTFRRTRRQLGRLWRGARLLVLVAGLTAAAIVLLFRWVNPPLTLLMAMEWRRLGGIER